MTIKIKDDDTFKEANEVHIKDGDTWKRTKKVHIKDDDTWKIAHESLATYTFTKDAAPATDGAYGVYTDIDLDDYFDADDKFWNCKVVIDSDVAIIALATGSGYGGTLTIENNGYILGHGGAGGDGGNASSY